MLRRLGFLCLLVSALLCAGACGDDSSSDRDGAVSTDGSSDLWAADGGSAEDQAAPPDQPTGQDLGVLPDEPPVSFPRTGIDATELALLINSSDPLSVALGAYYKSKRKIPAANVVTVSLPVKATLTAAEFAAVKTKVDQALPQTVQAIALAWLKPYKVDCQSITSAFALGFDKAQYCSKPCSTTAATTYYDTTSTRPYDDHQLRPTMMLAAVSETDGKALVDRGVAADGTLPAGKGFFLRTTDKARSVRWGDFKSTVASWNRADGITSEYRDNADGSGSNLLKSESDVLFYLTGLTKVADLATNSYRPGAIADHLTSFGGRLDGTGQMSVVRWLEGGATGSYGTCSEPCNYQAKLPRASVLLRHYFGGATLIEAYWKSVRSPGEGVFVGEPLARPFGSKVRYEPGKVLIETTIVRPGEDMELYGQTLAGTWELLRDAASLAVGKQARSTIEISPIAHKAYELRRKEQSAP